MQEKIEKSWAQKEKWPHLFLLISLLVLFLLYPFIAQRQFGVVVLNILGVAVLLSGTFAVRERKALLAAAIVLTAISVVANAVLTIRPIDWLVIVADCSVLVLLILFSINILASVLRSGRVTSDKIYGAICVYLLVGYGWAFAYAIMDWSQPGSFNGLTEADAADHVSHIQELRYFSFVTLTTVGFGDITPRTPVTRTFVTFEAVMGQIYLAVLVARLVGLHIVHAHDSEEEKR